MFHPTFSLHPLTNQNADWTELGREQQSVWIRWGHFQCSKGGGVVVFSQVCFFNIANRVDFRFCFVLIHRLPHRSTMSSRHPAWLLRDIHNMSFISRLLGGGGEYYGFPTVQKDRWNIGIFRGFIEKCSLFWDHRESLGTFQGAVFFIRSSWSREVTVLIWWIVFWCFFLFHKSYPSHPPPLQKNCIYSLRFHFGSGKYRQFSRIYREIQSFFEPKWSRTYSLMIPPPPL